MHNNHPRLSYGIGNISTLVNLFLQECENIVVETYTCKVPHHEVKVAQNIIYTMRWPVGSLHPEIYSNTLGSFANNVHCVPQRMAQAQENKKYIIMMRLFMCLLIT